MSDRWPAHLADRAAIFELQEDREPIEGPTRLPLIWDGFEFREIDPDSWRVVSVGRVETNQQKDEL